MAFGQGLERMMAMDDETWARHANPWSGWTRITALPLLALAIWSRVWLGWACLFPVLLVTIWIWFNPRIFAAPASTDNWMSQGVMGERIWLARGKTPIPAHHDRATKALNIATLFGVLMLIWGLVRLDFGITLAGLTLTMGAKLWFLDRMVWLKADRDAVNDAESAP